MKPSPSFKTRAPCIRCLAYLSGMVLFEILKFRLISLAAPSPLLPPPILAEFSQLFIKPYFRFYCF